MKAGVADQLEKARESCDAAGLMLERGYHAFAASRAYYSLFYIAQALLLDRNLSFSSHSGVIGAYGREFAKTQLLDPKFHKYLIQAQDIRNLADYGASKNLTIDQAEMLIQWANEFLDAAQQFLAHE
jgi:uncharacterized protein (UPF0332 family)